MRFWMVWRSWIVLDGLLSKNLFFESYLFELKLIKAHISISPFSPDGFWFIFLRIFYNLK